MQDRTSRRPLLPRTAAARLSFLFQRSGYVRRFAAARRAREGAQHYKKGYEVRLVLESVAEVREARRCLALVGLRPGKPFRKHARLVQPVYGEEALEWFVARLPAGRLRAAMGFDARAARRVRRRRGTGPDGRVTSS